INTKDDTFTGFIILYLGFSSVACSTYYILDDVYITPIFRRQGAARQLIDTAILFAKHEQALRITLETQKNNYQSHELYESMGFIKDNEFRSEERRVGKESRSRRTREKERETRI